MTSPPNQQKSTDWQFGPSPQLATRGHRRAFATVVLGRVFYGIGMKGEKRLHAIVCVCAEQMNELNWELP